jgi:uncharacterized protein (DUF1330 family)
MKKSYSIQKKVASILFVLLSTTIFNSSVVSATEGAFFIDILYLQEGKTVADANEYFDRVEAVVRKHGLRRIMPGLSVIQNMAGELNADLVNIWFMTDTQNTFNNIMGDPNYLKHIEFRNATFDMERANMMLLQPF